MAVTFEGQVVGWRLVEDGVHAGAHRRDRLVAGAMAIVPEIGRADRLVVGIILTCAEGIAVGSTALLQCLGQFGPRAMIGQHGQADEEGALFPAVGRRHGLHIGVRFDAVGQGVDLVVGGFFG